jgi:DNA-binding transcriptional ArsR family regulator
LTKAQVVERSGNGSRAVDAHLKALRTAGLVYRRRHPSKRDYLYYWQALLFYCEDEK